jgi:hypothetical protein
LLVVFDRLASIEPVTPDIFQVFLYRALEGAALKLVRVTPSDNLVHERAIGVQIGEVGVDDTVHSRSDKIEKLSAMDFGAKSNVEEGAVVKLGGRYFYAELDGKRTGDATSFNGRGS